MIERQRAKELLESLMVKGEEKEKKRRRDQTSRGNSLTVGQSKSREEAGERVTGVLVDDGLLDALKTSMFSALLEAGLADVIQAGFSFSARLVFHRLFLFVNRMQ